jgi:hypothetical protein
VIAVTLCLSGCGLPAPWTSVAAQPRDASAAWVPPRTADGQPDMQGIWRAGGGGGGGGMNVEEQANSNGRVGATSRSMVLDPPDGRVPYQPWARARRDEVRDNHLHPNRAQVDPRTRAWPDGVPRITYYGSNPFQIVQGPGWVALLYEAMHEFRVIPLDGRPHPGEDIKLWMGSSRGRWDGDTLVVDVANLSDRVRMSVVGDFYSDGARVTERWRFVNADTIEHTATITDPAVFTRPFTVGNTLRRVKDAGFEIMEYAGVEGERDAELMVDIPASSKRPR